VRLNHKTLAGLSGLALLVGCASNEPAAPVSKLAPDALSDAIAASCPEDVGYILPEKISVSATSLDWSETPEKTTKALGSLIPKALFELNSDDSRFGGLSGMDLLDDDTLIMTADDGSLIWLDFDPDTLIPSDIAYIAGLRDETGGMIDGKLDADSEGLAWNGETLFVSMERNHRILAYDIEGCGSAARGIPVLSFAPDGFGLGKAIHENRGMEALAQREGSELIAGLETNSDGSPIGIFSGPDARDFALRLPSPEITMLTGLDIVPVEGGPDRLYAVFRSYDPIRGNRIAIGAVAFDDTGPIGEMEQLALWGTEVMVDNFEGITARSISETHDQILIISDNNFSSRQKTLLAVFEHEH